MSATIRKAAVAGSWYPGGAAALAAEVDEYLEAAGEPSVQGRLVALISPHAGLRFSGPVAAHGYGLLRGRSPLTAVMVGPSHRAAFDGVAVHAHGAWETPLGRAPIDEKLAEALLASDPEFRRRAGEASRQRALRFTWDEQAHKIAEFFEEHLAAARR